MKRGKKPVPTRLRVLKGARPSRLVVNEPKPESNNIKMPSWLSTEGKKQFKALSKELDDARIITNLDTHALALYCEAYSTWIKATKTLQKEGSVIDSKNGFPTQSPYVLVANKAFDQMKVMLAEFGMTPSSRRRVSVVPKKDEHNPWADL